MLADSEQISSSGYFELPVCPLFLLLLMLAPTVFSLSDGLDPSNKLAYS